MVSDLRLGVGVKVGELEADRSVRGWKSMEMLVRILSLSCTACTNRLQSIICSDNNMLYFAPKHPPVACT